MRTSTTSTTTTLHLVYLLIRISKVEEEMANYAELKKKVSGIMVREEEGPLEMLTDLGADCFVKVKVRPHYAHRV